MNRFSNPELENKVRAARQAIKDDVGQLCRKKKQTDKLMKLSDKPCTCHGDTQCHCADDRKFKS